MQSTRVIFPRDVGDPPDVTIQRRGKGVLERQVRDVCDGYVTGEIDFEGKPVTPYRVAQKIEELYGGGVRPSTGSITAIFNRWAKIGAATFDAKPVAFIGYTVEASEIGFVALAERAKRTS